MDNVQINKKLKILTSKCDDIKHEKKLLTEDFEKLKKYVMISGIVSLGCIMFYTIIISRCLNSKSPSVKAFGRFQGPFIFAVFVVAFIIFTLKGFDFFINADTKYSKKVAKKLDKMTVTDRLNDLNSTIMRLELEIGKLENSIYEHRGKEGAVYAHEETENSIAQNHTEESDVYKNFASEDTVYAGRPTESDLYEYEKQTTEETVYGNPLTAGYMYDNHMAESSVYDNHLTKDTAYGYTGEQNSIYNDNTMKNNVMENSVMENSVMENSVMQNAGYIQENTTSAIRQPQETQTSTAWSRAQENNSNMVDFFKIAGDTDDADDEEADMSGMIMKKAEMQQRVQVKSINISENKDVESNVFSGNNNNIDEIFSGLDEFWEEEDELENSSDLWKQDTMKHYK